MNWNNFSKSNESDRYSIMYQDRLSAPFLSSLFCFLAPVRWASLSEERFRYKLKHGNLTWKLTLIDAWALLHSRPPFPFYLTTNFLIRDTGLTKFCFLLHCCWSGFFSFVKSFCRIKITFFTDHSVAVSSSYVRQKSPNVCYCRRKG